MRFVTGRVAIGLALGLSVGLASGAQNDKEVAAARQDILDLARQAEAGKDITKQAVALSKKYDELIALMYVYKPRSRGGIGFGAKPTSGIEVKIRDLKKEALSRATLQKESKELLRLGYVNVAMAEVARAYFALPKDNQTRKDWARHLDNQKKAVQELIAAVKARDPVKLKTAAANLDSACSKCHDDFR